MDGLMHSSTGKRRLAESRYGEDNVRNKKPNVSSTSSGIGRGREPAMPGVGSTVYRILCPTTLIGGIIGKGGQVIQSLRKETHSKIQVADGVPGADQERVIIIYSSHDDVKDSENVEATVCPAQDALLRLHSLILQHADCKQQVINARLLIANSQIGSLIGKGGNNIEKMRNDSGAQIRILPRQQLSASTALTMTGVDELVQISGDATAVKKALFAVSTFLHEHPPKEQIPNWNNSNNYLPRGNGNSMFSCHNIAGYPIVGLASGLGSAWPLNNYSRVDIPIVSNLGTSADRNKRPSEEFIIRILCPNDKIGGVIGKGGNIIQNMRKETGASIKVEDATTTTECDSERVIVVSTTEFADDRVSPTLEAILQLQGKSSGRISNSSTSTSTSTSEKENLRAGSIISTRLLVPSQHIGCLLGKGGSIIKEMRKKTGADIRVFPKEDRENGVEVVQISGEAGGLEVVQISGEAGVARDALIQVITRLRERLFKDVKKDAAYLSGRHV